MIQKPFHRSIALTVLLAAVLGMAACSQEDQAAAQNAANEATAKAAALADQARETAVAVADSARETAGQAADAARETAAKAADEARVMADKAGVAAREAADKAGTKAGELAEQAGTAARDLGDKAGQSASELVDRASTAVRQAGDGTGDGASPGDASDGAAGNALDRPVDRVVDAAASGGSAVAGAAGSAADGASGSNAGSTAGNAVSMAAGTVAAAAAGAAATGAGATPADASAATSAADKAATAGEPIKAAWVYVGPVGDAGWTFAHDNGRKAAQAAMGQRMASSFVESVAESADAERVLRDLAVQGNDIIFGTTFGYMETMRKLSREFPDVRWEHATGYKTTDNMRTYDSRTYQGAYLAGLIAGAMTTSNTLGVVGSIPIPEVVRNINSFTLGAQTMNPDIKTRVVWVNKWFDPPRETEAAQSLIDQGADVLFQNTDSAAVLQTAEKAGKFAFGWNSDMTAYGPRAHLASAIINWAPYYTERVQAVAADTWETGSVWSGVAEGAIDLVSISDRVPPEVRTSVERIKAGLKDGSFNIWTGPIVNNEGKEVLAAGKVADDAFLGGVNFFVEGVEGKLPTPR